MKNLIMVMALILMLLAVNGLFLEKNIVPASQVNAFRPEIRELARSAIPEWMLSLGAKESLGIEPGE